MNVLRDYLERKWDEDGVIRGKMFTFINKANCIFDHEELEKAILWYANGEEIKYTKVIACNNTPYPELSIRGKQLRVHRLLMMYWTGRHLDESELVHHIDENKANASRENLEIVDKAEHNRIHFKGKPLSEQHKKKIGEAGKKRTGTQIKKKVSVPVEIVEDLVLRGWRVKSIADFFRVDPNTIIRRIKQSSLVEFGKVYNPSRYTLVLDGQRKPEAIKLHPKNTSGAPNVYWKKQNKKWSVDITVNGKKKFIGLYDDFLEAKEAAASARKKYILSKK